MMNSSTKSLHTNLANMNMEFSTLTTIESSSNSSLSDTMGGDEPLQSSKTTRQTKESAASHKIFASKATNSRSPANRISRQYNINEEDCISSSQLRVNNQINCSNTSSIGCLTISIGSASPSPINTLLQPPNDAQFDSPHSLTLNTPIHEPLSRKSSCNSVRFTKYLLNQGYSSSQDTTNYLNVNADAANANDLTYEAEILENSVKKNDKYSVRRILEQHHSNFQIKPPEIHQNASTTGHKNRQLSTQCSTQTENNYYCPPKIAKKLNNSEIYHTIFSASTMSDVVNNSENLSMSIDKPCNVYVNKANPNMPPIFYNILHYSIECNSLDVLRICLKYGLNPNETGTNRRLANNFNNNNNTENTKNCRNNAIKMPFKCAYCLRKCSNGSSAPRRANSSNTTNLNPNVNNNYLSIRSPSNSSLQNKLSKLKNSSQSSSATNNTYSFETTSSYDEVNYSSYNYLLRLPPLFLSVSKCAHNATELLLEYGACPNIQDEFGNTAFHLAASKRDACKECIALLLKYHASSAVCNNLGYSVDTILTHMHSSIDLTQIRVKIIEDLFSSSSISTNIVTSSMHNFNLSLAKSLFNSIGGNSLTNTLISSNSINHNSSLKINKNLKSVSTMDMLGVSNRANSVIKQSSLTDQNSAVNSKSKLQTQHSKQQASTASPAEPKSNLVIEKNSSSTSPGKNNLKKSASSISNQRALKKAANITASTLILKRQSSDNKQQQQQQPQQQQLESSLCNVNRVTSNSNNVVSNNINNNQPIQSTNNIANVNNTNINGSIVNNCNSNTIINNSNSGNGFRKNDSRQISTDYDTNLTNKHDSMSLVSSKLSLFKKMVNS